MSSLSAASALPVTDVAAGDGGARPRGSGGVGDAGGNRGAAGQDGASGANGLSTLFARRSIRVLVAATAVSLILHLLGITGAADWLTEHFRWKEPDEGPPLRAVLLPPPPPVYQVAAKPPPPRPKPKPKPTAVPPPMFAAAPVVEPEPALSDVPAPIAAAAPIPAAAPSADPAPEPAAPPIPAVEPPPPAVAETAPEPEPEVPPAPTAKVPKRIDLVGTLFVGDQNFMVGEGGFRLRHDGNRYEISVLGTPKGLARMLFAGEFSGVSRGAITPTGLQPSEYTEERGGATRRERATLDWEAGVVRLKDDKVAPLEPPMFDRLSVLLQFYYRPPEATELTMRVAGTRGIDTYVFRRLRNETLELPSRTIDAQLWRVNHDTGEPRIDLWMSPEYHYLPLRVRVYARKEFGGRHATLHIDEIRVDN